MHACMHECMYFYVCMSVCTYVRMYVHVMYFLCKMVGSRSCLYSALSRVMCISVNLCGEVFSESHPK